MSEPLHEDFDVKVLGAMFAALVLCGVPMYMWPLLSGHLIWPLAIFCGVLGMVFVLKFRPPVPQGRRDGLLFVLLAAGVAGALGVATLLHVVNVFLDFRAPTRRTASVADLRDAKNPGARFSIGPDLEAKVYVGHGDEKDRIRHVGALEVAVWPGALGEPYLVHSDIVDAVMR